MNRRAVALCALALLVSACLPICAQPRVVTVATTTSTGQSGLLPHLVAQFRSSTGIDVRLRILGTRKTLEAGRRGEVDVLLTHDADAEMRFVNDGHGVSYHRVMYSDYLLAGPKSDPARTAGKNIITALQRIADSRAPFVSRGDRGGTHAAELRLWADAARTPRRGTHSWYRETGLGQDATLEAAAGLDAYVLTDRATFVSSPQKGRLAILVEGDKRLFNQYGVMLVNPERHRGVKGELGQAFIDWLVSREGQRSIAAYRVAGAQVFFPNAIR